jgi:predicted AlkP superfamily pyrophosphatase or phosphodiesterase
VKKWIPYLIALAVLSAEARPRQAGPPVMPGNAMLIGWDGAHRDHVKALLKEGKLPNLQKLIQEGTLVDIDVTSGATDTKAGWSQILTGYRPEVTGVFSNALFRDIHAGYSIFERLRSQFGADRIATVAVIGKKGHVGGIDAPFKKRYDSMSRAELRKLENMGKTVLGKEDSTAKPVRTVEEGGVKYVVFDGMPYYTMHKNVDEWHYGLTLDEKVGDKALEMLDKYAKKPFFFFVHFAEVDHNGHRFGEPSKEYNDALISGDRQLGRLRDKLERLGVYDKTLIYVTADHGFNIGASGHRYAPYVFLATNDKKVMRSGTRTDIAPTVLDRMGVDLSKIEPRLDGETLAKPAVKPVGKAPAAPPTARRKKKAA